MGGNTKDFSGLWDTVQSLGPHLHLNPPEEMEFQSRTLCLKLVTHHLGENDLNCTSDVQNRPTYRDGNYISC